MLVRHGIPEKFLTMAPYCHQWPLPSLLCIMAFTTTLVAPFTSQSNGETKHVEQTVKSILQIFT